MPIQINSLPNLLLAAVVLLIPWAPPANAGTPTLDQFQLGSNQTGAIQFGSYHYQTFSPQIAGFLSGVEVSLYISPAGTPVNAEVWSQGLRLGHVAIEPEDVGGFPDGLTQGSVTGTYVDFTAFAIPTEIGVELEFRVVNPPGGSVLPTLHRQLGDDYPGGHMGQHTGPVNADLAFKTFVESSVPQGDFDHFQPDGVDQSVALHSASGFGQTLTVVGSGTLAALELSLSAPFGSDDDLTIEFFRHGASRSTSLGSVSLSEEDIHAAGIPLFLRHAEVLGVLVDLSPLEAAVSAGDVIEFRFQSTNTHGFYTGRRSTVNVYSGGSTTNNGSPSAGDFAFKLFLEQDGLFADGFESGNTMNWN